MPHRRLALVPAALALAACGQNTAEPFELDDSAVRVVNATQAPLDVLLDGEVALRGLPASAVSNPLPVTSGARRLQLRPTAGGAAAEVALQVPSGQALTTAAVSVGATLTAAVLADTNAAVPAGKTKLRVSNLAASATTVELFRTQPDFATPVRISTPFPYNTTSPYLQSDAGSWEVFVAPAGSAGTPKGATTGPIALAAGQRRTVVLLDSAGVLRFRVIAD
ncbi:DUF4397 domain-containing protein [Roseisolibacter sp. H3M3-2]|uniref:DUF4397 domain-containing protein n=1 Tax=Roseisolibacter sp. H3M3-2 TaxID=3031323 RepID=UPI0023DB4740|nr:DUF4397 domain-containing protein [Roseisolibacter sp. H3M3-2]MDF1505435.1 DUF4397 domain-containing protein [Roseisolibacter sp. H3M3-2]